MKRPAKPWMQPRYSRLIPRSTDYETQVGDAWEQVPDDIDTWSLAAAVMTLRLQRDYEKRAADKWRDFATEMVRRR